MFKEAYNVDNNGLNEFAALRYYFDFENFLCF